MSESVDGVFESTEGMSETCKIGLRNLLIACSDTKLLLGYHYGEWTFGPPEIEAAVACCSLCQSELGHARLLHAILYKHYGDDPDDLVESRPSTEFANIPYLDNEIGDWAQFAAANYLVDLAVTTMLYTMKNSSFKPLHMSLDKMLEEERYHIHHGQGWVRTLAQKSPETKQAVGHAVHHALADVVQWFGPENEDEDTALVDAGVKEISNTVALARLLREIGLLVESLGLNTGLAMTTDGTWQFNESVDWETWRPQTRRLSQTGPDDQILYHLRGSKNKVFKL